MLGRDFFDFHSAFGGSHDHHLRDGAIDDQTQVKLASDVGTFFDPDFMNFLSMSTGLRGQ